MDVQSFSQIEERVLQSGRQFRVAVVNAGDPHSLEAIFLAAERGVARPILVGDRAKILALLADMGKSAPEEDIYDAPDAPASVAKAVALVGEGKADFLMKGKLETPVLLKGVTNPAGGLNQGRIMSALFLAQIPGYHKLLAVVDGGMLTYPSLEQKKALIENTAAAMRALGCQEPKVGVLACIEKVNPKMPETVEAAELKRMNQEGELTGCVVEGPISYDCAMSVECAREKGFESPVVGQCDILIAPNIHAANIVSKALSVTCGALSAGCILGAKCPVVMSSRGSSPEEKCRSVLLAAAIFLGGENARKGA